MASKVLVFVLAALFTASVLADRPSIDKTSLEQIINGAFDKLIDFAEQFLLEVNKAMSIAIHETALGIRSMLEALEEIGKYGVQLADKVIEAEFAILIAVIDKYKNETSDESMAIWQCINDVEGEAIQVREEAVNNSVICIDAAIQQVGDGTMQILVDIRTLNEDLRTEEKTLENCKNETIPTDCIKGVLDNLWDIVVTLTTTIETDADKAQADYDNLGVVFEACVNDTTTVLQRENARIYNEFSQCVAEHSSTAGS